MQAKGVCFNAIDATDLVLCQFFWTGSSSGLDQSARISVVCG